jgi:hypothetical protein
LSDTFSKTKKKNMFGLNEISWGIFIELLCLGLTGWYVLVFILSWIKQKSDNPSLFFEDYRTGSSRPENLQPITVSSKDFPSEIINGISEKQIPLETSFYEETGLDEGYGIDHFVDGNSPKLSEILSEVQYQY